MKNNKLILENAKEKFANARELCPGMSEDVYMITDFLSGIVHDTLLPQALVMCLALFGSDLDRGLNGFDRDKPLSDDILERKNQLMSQMIYVPQVVDKIASEEFAREFRKLCKEILRFDPPKRVDVKSDIEYPPYVVAAVEWWANAIQSPKFDNGEAMPSFLMIMLANNTASFSSEDIKRFKDSLATDILKEIEMDGYSRLYVDYDPCYILRRAGDLIKFHNFPWKTSMEITPEKVTVRDGYGASTKQIWPEILEKSRKRK